MYRVSCSRLLHISTVKCLLVLDCSFLYSFKLQLISLFNRSLDLRTCDTAHCCRLATTRCPPAASTAGTARGERNSGEGVVEKWGVGARCLGCCVAGHNFHSGAAREEHLLNGWLQQPRAAAAAGGGADEGAAARRGGGEGAAAWTGGCSSLPSWFFLSTTLRSARLI